MAGSTVATPGRLGPRLPRRGVFQHTPLPGSRARKKVDQSTHHAPSDAFPPPGSRDRQSVAETPCHAPAVIQVMLHPPLPIFPLIPSASNTAAKESSQRFRSFTLNQ
jgi:hypothetical protein